MLYHQGRCPQCGQVITPLHRLEANILRRDVLECPHCRARILECRTPGCHDYALGGRVWDNDFCPACTKQISQAAFVGGLGLVLGTYLESRTGRNLPPWDYRGVK